MFHELLLEIGTEEIPSDYLENGLKALRDLAESQLKNSRIEIGEPLVAYGTPRRLVLIGRAVQDKQDDTVQEITGPPKAAAFDDKGNPTKAALGFAKKHGVSVQDLGLLGTPKGDYLFVKRSIPGKPTAEVLSGVFPRILADIPWPKSMRWGSEGFPFVRPIHWMIALYDNAVIPFEVAGIKSGNSTAGHRFMAPRMMQVASLDDYLAKLGKSFVLLDQKVRARKVEEVVAEAAAGVSGVPIKDEELVSTVANMVEYPSAVCGSFDKSFLAIPSPVLITAMKKHQKYFALQDSQGRLMPNFVAINNTIAKDEDLVRKGHEKVLRARLSDASFFFKEDRKKPLEARLEDLKGVIYQAELGTSYAKVQRFTALAEFVAEKVAPDKLQHVRLAARLCKCDLVTQMVTEFPTLQGVMGMEYARLDGHPEEACVAVHEHYLPARAGDELPSSAPGAIVSVADRMDTIAGFFAIGLEPTGAADPFALRRHALAIIRILESRDWDVSLKALASKALSILAKEISFDETLILNKVLDFFRERYRQMMLRSDYGYGLVEAAIAVEFDRINEVRSRLDQLQTFVKEFGEFESFVLTSKRISNILKNQDETMRVQPALFKAPCESKLWESYQAVKRPIEDFIEKKNTYQALKLMATLKGPVDDFFNGVEILTKESAELKNNRVGMLQELSRLFLKVADFSKFAI
ncbi:MAG TPA: glycine--tRNA ligase subunit beta [Desulfatiglandales bacterium]